MRVLQVVYAFYPLYRGSGDSRVAYEISKGLASKGHKVTVYTTNVLSGDTMFAPKNKKYYIDDIEIWCFKNIIYKPRSLIPIFYSGDLIRAIRRNLAKYDIIHLHHYRFYICPFLHHYAVKYRVPYVLQAHGSIPRIGKQSLKWFYDVLFGNRLLKDASRVIALNRVEAGQYRSMGVPEEKIAIIPNGIDLSEYANLPPKGQFKRKFNIPEDKKIVLYLGRIHRIKGIDFLVEAYAYLTKKMNFKDAVLVIAGPDDGYLTEAKSLANSLGVSDSVLFTGLLSEIDKIRAYVDCTVCVYLNPYEPFGLVPLEAAACGSPVIVSNFTPMSEIIKLGDFGFSVNYGDITELAKTMEAILRNEDLVDEKGKKGREYVFANFDWSKIVTKLEKVYREIVS